MAFQASKRAFDSLTIRASAVVILLSTLSAFGIDIAPDLAPQLGDIIKGVAGAVAVYGRFRANTAIV